MTIEEFLSLWFNLSEMFDFSQSQSLELASLFWYGFDGGKSCWDELAASGIPILVVILVGFGLTEPEPTHQVNVRSMLFWL